MSALATQLAERAAWARLMARERADLKAYCERAWSDWRRHVASFKPNSFARDLVIVIDVASTADITSHVGAMRWLVSEPERVNLILRVPSEESKAFVTADAHAQGWNLMVSILTAKECDAVLKALPEGVEAIIYAAPDTEREAGRAGFATRAKRMKALSLEELERYERPLEVIDDGELGVVGKTEAETGTMDLGEVAPKSEIIASQPDRVLRPKIFMRRTAFIDQAAPSGPIHLPADYFGPQSRPIELTKAIADGRVEQLREPLYIPPEKIEPWMLSAYVNRGGGGNAMIRAFAEGTGCRLAYAEDEGERLSHIPVVWGVLRDSDRILAQAKDQGLYWYYIDHAYFSRGHGKNYRISRNRYEAGPLRVVPDDRIKTLDVELKPWRKSRGDLMIICPPTDYFMNAHGCHNWLSRTINELKTYTDRPFVVREKPKAGQPFLPLAEALEDAHCLITHSSNVAIEAACLGTPVFVSPASAAAPVGETELRRIDHPVMPDREPWLAHLAYNQFSIDEIRDGRAWQILKENEERPLA